MLFSYPAAIVAVAVAFYRGGGRLMAYGAFAIVSAELVLILVAAGAGAVPMACGFGGIAVFGLYGYKTRHRRRPLREYRYALQKDAPPVSAVIAERKIESLSVDDLAGLWQLYSDADGRMVRLVLDTAGTYRQTLIDNCGEVRQCPGGTWELNGAELRFSLYCPTDGSAAREETWILRETSAGVVVEARQEAGGNLSRRELDSRCGGTRHDSSEARRGNSGRFARRGNCHVGRLRPGWTCRTTHISSVEPSANLKAPGRFLESVEPEPSRSCVWHNPPRLKLEF